MEVDFNGLRKGLVRDYNGLVRQLNGEPGIYVNTVAKSMENIRMGMVVLLCCYDDQAGIEDLSNDIEVIEFMPKDS